MEREEFIRKAEQVHGCKYDYALSQYGKDGRSERTIIGCPKHGSFLQRPKNHLAGRGCNRCTVEANSVAKSAKSAQSFVDRAISFHGGRYDYSLVEYKTATTKVEVVCHQHGAFSVTPNNHLSGRGCRECGLSVNLMSRSEFVERANTIHGGKYDYSLVEISMGQRKVIIRCANHGCFEQDYSGHLRGNGCPGCAKTGYDATKGGTFYVLEFGNITKIGITNRDVTARVGQIKNNSGKSFTVAAQFNFNDGRIPLRFETSLLRELRATHAQPSEKYDGATESFLDVDTSALLSRIHELCKEHL